MTPQELFDIAYKGIASQGFKRSSIGGGRCVYRGPDGLKCAIGWAIPDDKYNPVMDRTGHQAHAFGAIGIDVYSNMGHFAANLQEAHDKSETPNLMRYNLRNFAQLHALTIPEVSA